MSENGAIKTGVGHPSQPLEAGLAGPTSRGESDEVMHEVDDSKAQIIWNGDSAIITIPTDKVSRAFARGILREAEDQICIHYVKRAQQRQMIATPSHNLRNKLAKLNPFG